MTPVHNRLRAVLEDRQMSQADLADLTGIPYTAIRRMLRPRSCPPLGHALVVSRVLGLAVEDLFWLDVEPVAERIRSQRQPVRPVAETSAEASAEVRRPARSSS